MNVTMAGCGTELTFLVAVTLFNHINIKTNKSIRLHLSRKLHNCPLLLSVIFKQRTKYFASSGGACNLYSENSRFSTRLRYCLRPFMLLLSHLDGGTTVSFHILSMIQSCILKCSQGSQTNHKLAPYRNKQPAH